MAVWFFCENHTARIRYTIPHLRKHVLESRLIAFPHLLMLGKPVIWLVFSVKFEFFSWGFTKIPILMTS